MSSDTPELWVGGNKRFNVLQNFKLVWWNSLDKIVGGPRETN